MYMSYKVFIPEPSTLIRLNMILFIGDLFLSYWRFNLTYLNQVIKFKLNLRNCRPLAILYDPLGSPDPILEAFLLTDFCTFL